MLLALNTACRARALAQSQPSLTRVLPGGMILFINISSAPLPFGFDFIAIHVLSHPLEFEESPQGTKAAHGSAIVAVYVTLHVCRQFSGGSDKTNAAAVTTANIRAPVIVIFIVTTARGFSCKRELDAAILGAV